MRGLLTVLLAVLALTEPARDSLKVRLKASAPGSGIAGRVAAVAKAEREAVFEFAKSITSAVNPSVFEPVLDRAPAYIRSWQMLSQKQMGADTTVNIEAYLLEKPLRRDLASLLLPLFPRPPRVVVVLEQIPGETQAPTLDMGRFEKRFVDTFRDAGLDVVDPKVVHARCPAPQALERVRGDGALVARFARENFADAAVVGEATVVTVPPARGSNLLTNHATLTLRTVRANDARVCDLESSEAIVESCVAADGAAMALSDACDKLKEPALVSVVLACAGAKRPDHLVITVKQLQDRKQWEAFCHTLGKQPGVGDVEKLYYGDGTGRVCVKYTGPLEPFMDDLTGPRYVSFHLKPRRVVGRDVSLVVTR